MMTKYSLLVYFPNYIRNLNGDQVCEIESVSRVMCAQWSYKRHAIKLKPSFEYINDCSLSISSCLYFCITILNKPVHNSLLN